MDRRLVVETMLLGQPLPFRSRRRFHQRRHSTVEQIVVLGHVNDIEDHSLILLAVVNREVEPETISRIASVWSEAQVVLEFSDQQNISQISGFEGGIEAQIS